MRITPEQDALLKKFSCVRLSSDEENAEKIKTFENPKGTRLIQYMQRIGWGQDQRNETAFYLINMPSGIPALFFALKCGSLYRPLNEQEIAERVQQASDFLEVLNSSTEDNPRRSQLLSSMKQLASETNLSLEQVIAHITSNAKKDQSKHSRILADLENDKTREGERPIQRVGATFSGAELTHFCTNIHAQKEWKSYGFRYPLGAVLFWRYIVPKFIELQTIAGCQYAFLFAADNTPDGSLTNYYNVTLKFEQPIDIGTSKPRYDFCCEFMCQEVNQMKLHMDSFFENFNIDDGEEVV